MRSVDEWRGLTDDAAVPSRVRQRIHERFLGRCPVCTRELRAGHWELDHMEALINGGEHRERNLRPICKGCHKGKSSQDAAEKSHTAKVRQRHLGIKRRHKTIPGRKFDGTPIPSRWRDD